MTRVVVACPRCGSTDAGEGDSSALPPTLYRMGCNRCGHQQTCDDEDLKLEWNVSVPDGATPRFVAPTDRLRRALEKVFPAAGVPAQVEARQLCVPVWGGALEGLSEQLAALADDDAFEELVLWLRPVDPARVRALLEPLTPGRPELLDAVLSRLR